MSAAPGTRRLSVRDGLLLWFGVVAPPAAWVLHFGLGWLFDEAACMNDTAVGAVEPLIVVSTVVLGAVSLAGGLAGYAIFLRLRRGELFDPRGRLAMLAVAAMLGAFLFTALDVLEGVQVVSFSACRPG
jgi:hypothetical protein